MMKPTLITRVRQTILALPLMLLGSSLVAQTPLVQNPSFESNFNPTWPHYSGVDEWSGGSGINDRSLDSGGPFHDNGLTPDRDRVAFIQNVGSLSQTIFGLTPGQTYWIQFFYKPVPSLIGKFPLWRAAGPRSETCSRWADQPFTYAPSRSRRIRTTGLVSASFRTASSALFDAVTIVARMRMNLVASTELRGQRYQPNTASSPKWPAGRAGGVRRDMLRLLCR